MGQVIGDNLSQSRRLPIPIIALVDGRSEASGGGLRPGAPHRVYTSCADNRLGNDDLSALPAQRCRWDRIPHSIGDPSLNPPGCSRCTTRFARLTTGKPHDCGRVRSDVARYTASVTGYRNRCNGCDGWRGKRPSPAIGRTAGGRDNVTIARRYTLPASRHRTMPVPECSHDL